MVKVGVLLGREPEPLGEWLADAAAFDAAGADALWVDPGEHVDVLVLAGALAVITFRARLVVAVPDIEPDERALYTIERLSHGRFTRLGEAEPWEPAPAPASRADWALTCADAAERGVPGLIVPADPRLLDILRNPDDPGERHDLQLAQG